MYHSKFQVTCIHNYCSKLFPANRAASERWTACPGLPAESEAHTVQQRNAFLALYDDNVEVKTDAADSLSALLKLFFLFYDKRRKKKETLKKMNSRISNFEGGSGENCLYELWPKITTVAGGEFPWSSCN